MMKNFESVERKLVESGKADAIRQIADSADGQRLAEKLDAKKVEQAAKSGDAEALRGILLEVLSTGEGKRLAEQLQKAMKE
ncbi:MAG: DUF935 domain-containing protein [Oscillospiraceae bacterium]|nr:DUF935 domain-containing protein [Oscillospiraceae bacterium]MDD6502491.1 hypothetical protein [Oscillospiraceae bacterium]MDY4104661.1 hypothetical protein [Oscillospiraceae bacterium]